MRNYKGYFIPDIKEIEAIQRKITDAREAGTHVYMCYMPYTGEFHAEITEAGRNPTYKYLHFVTYIPPWKDARELRQEIIDYIDRKVSERNGKV